MATLPDDSLLKVALRRYAEIPAEQFERMRRGVRLVDAKKGAVLQRQGEAADWLGFLERGLVRSYRNLDGREINLGFELDGGFTGAYDAYMQRRPAQYALQALEDCRVWVFDRALLDELILAHPCWSTMSGRVAEEELAHKLDEELQLRTQSPEQRYAAMCRSGSPLVRRVPQYHLASFLGVAPETLSRIRARMG